MARVPGANPGTPSWPLPYGPLPVPQLAPPIWTLASEDLAVFTLGRLLVTPENHLAEVVRSKPGKPVHMGKCHIPPHFGPFWAYLCTLPQGDELLVEPLVKSLFGPKSASPNEFLVRTPPPPIACFRQYICVFHLIWFWVPGPPKFCQLPQSRGNGLILAAFCDERTLVHKHLQLAEQKLALAQQLLMAIVNEPSPFAKNDYHAIALPPSHESVLVHEYGLCSLGIRMWSLVKACSQGERWLG